MNQKNKQGFLIVAQNSGKTDYVLQACALAKSIHNTQKVKNVSILTNDPIPDEYVHLFDKIIEIPFGDQAKDKKWKIENRWKVYVTSPYYETIVLDSDMLALSSLEHCWKFVKHRDLHFTSVVKNYKGNIVTDNTYRRMFVENDLPNIYTGMYFFRKSELAETFFKLLEYISYKWERFFYEIAPTNYQRFFSIDVASAIAIKILGIDDIVLHKNSPFTFVHMKPALQEWSPVPSTCYKQAVPNFNTKKQLFIGNYIQEGLFHYVEDSFLTKNVLDRLND
jgi:hypothetical protein